MGQNSSANGNEKTIFPIAFYTIVIGLMLYTAILTLVREEWFFYSAIPVSMGALLFTGSDIQLAWNKFVTPLSHAKIRIIIAYHLGQILIIYGAVTQFSG